MAIFLGVHDMGSSVPEEQMAASWAKYKIACEKLGCTPQHVHFNAEAGQAYCLTEASSVDLVQKAHGEAGVPLREVLEVKTAE